MLFLCGSALIDNSDDNRTEPLLLILLLLLLGAAIWEDVFDDVLAHAAAMAALWLLVATSLVMLTSAFTLLARMRGWRDDQDDDTVPSFHLSEAELSQGRGPIGRGRVRETAARHQSHGLPRWP